MSREQVYVTKKLSAGSFTFPCGVIWFTISPEDSDIDAEFQIKGTRGDVLNYRNIALTSPENMPFQSEAGNDITVTWVEGTININYIV